MLSCTLHFFISASVSASVFQNKNQISNYYQSKQFTNDHNNSPDYKIKYHMNRIKTQYSLWEGVKYKLGGSTKNGIDCSALMQKLYNSIQDYSLPRTTSGQIRSGLEVKKTELVHGDLVFFKLKNQQYHVGFYIGNHNFIHASTRKGVTISTLNNLYWSTRFITARRII